MTLTAHHTTDLAISPVDGTTSLHPALRSEPFPPSSADASQEDLADADATRDLRDIIRAKAALSGLHEDGARAIAHGDIGQLAATLARMAAQIRGMDDGVRTVTDGQRQMFGFHLGMLLQSVYYCIEQLYKDLITAGIHQEHQQVRDVIASSMTVDEFLDAQRRSDTARLIANIEKNAGNRNLGLTMMRSNARRKTEFSCRPWCVIQNPRECEGHCMADAHMILATADGGRFYDDGLKLPLVEVYAGVSYPSSIESVHLIPRGPFATNGTINGWVELTPDEARQVAAALIAEADRICVEHLSRD